MVTKNQDANRCILANQAKRSLFSSSLKNETMTLLSLRKILTQKMPTSMSHYFLLYVTTAATAMHFQVAKQILCWRFSVFAGENIEISNLGAVETSVSRASAILGNFLTPRLNPSWPPLFYPSTFLTTTFVCHLRAIAKHQMWDGFCHQCDTSVQSEFLLLASLPKQFPVRHQTSLYYIVTFCLYLQAHLRIVEYFSCLLLLLSTSPTLILTYLWFVQALGAGCLWFYEKFWGVFWDYDTAQRHVFSSEALA